MSRIFITGMGIVSAIGDDVQQNRASLVASRSGILYDMDLFSTKHAGILPFGVVKKSSPLLRNELNAHDADVTRTTLLALKAFDEAVLNSKLSPSLLMSHDTALVSSSTVGGMCLTDELYHDANEKEKGSPYLASYDNASATLFLQKRYRIGGIVNTINTACSSSANAIQFGANLLHNGMAKRAIVGGADSLAKFTINGFNALYILSQELCRPFDENRSGLNLGEGAAFLVLEKEEDVGSKKVYATLSGYANANDAYHPSSLSDAGDGPILAMQGALLKANLKPHNIDFINAHGTGTENNDVVESRAMRYVFNSMAAFASTKSYTGHTLGASAAVEAVFSVMNLSHQEIYRGLHFNKAIPETNLVPVQAHEKRKILHVMSNSFGFGGNCSSLIFSKI